MDELNAKRISELLSLPEVCVVAEKCLPSTNDACRFMLKSGEYKCLVVAAAQTGGRGRRGRAFFSPPGGL